MSARLLSNWLGHPLAESFLRFNLLPSTLLHPERGAAVVQRELRDLPALQRHRSAALIEEHGLDPVLGLHDPVLPLAMLPDPYLKRLLVLLGVALNAPHVRRTIARADLAMLNAQLGSEGLAAARMPAAAALAGLPKAPDWKAEHAGALCTAWGSALLTHAFDSAAPEVAGRARLRLSPDADALRAPLAAAGLAPQCALQVALEMLQSLEPAWLSSFPTAR